jgi:streptogramin lyase
MMDDRDRLWFGENRADRIGMFDTRTQKFQEWAAPTPGAWPYDVTIDKNGEVWSGGEYNDRILRLNPKTGQFVEYLLPGRRTSAACSSTTRRAGHVLGRQQPRRLHRQAGDARLAASRHGGPLIHDRRD